MEGIVLRVYCCNFQDCYMEYASKYNLKRHVNVSHLKNKQATCSFCSKQFINKQNLKEHYFIHSKIKPYPCEVCSKTFRHKTAYIKHKKAHLKAIN